MTSSRFATVNKEELQKLIEAKDAESTQRSIDWSLTCPQSRVIGRFLREPASGETNKLCIESHSGVFILLTAVIAAVIGHSKFVVAQPLHEQRFNISRMNR